MTEIQLNTHQQAVVDAPIDQHICVLAAAGSGKTTTIIHRVERMIKSEGVDPNCIQVLTFNRSAAMDMLDRAKNLIGDNATFERFSTIDSFARNIVLNTAPGASPKDAHVSEFLHILMEQVSEGNTQLIKRTSIIRYLFIDEYQDMSTIQEEFIQWMEDRGTIICCIGDDMQSINEWRDANLENIRAKARKYALYSLPINYRSTQSIVAFCNAIADNEEEKILGKLPMQAAPNAEIGVMPIVYNFSIKRTEYEWIVKEIEKIPKEERHKVAVIVPTNRKAREFIKGWWGLMGPVFDGAPDILTQDDEKGKARVMTMHRSKGLEFDYVFLSGMDAAYPAYCSPILSKEYRRVFYVACSRAETKLFITYSRRGKRSLPGTRYLSELDIDLYTEWGNRLFKEKYLTSKYSYEATTRWANPLVTVTDNLTQGLSGADYRKMRADGILNLKWEPHSPLSHKETKWPQQYTNNQKRWAGRQFDRYVCDNVVRDSPLEGVSTSRFLSNRFKESHKYITEMRRYRGNGRKHTNLVTQESYEQGVSKGRILKGASDIRASVSIHELKLSINELSGDWTVQLLCYVAMARAQGIEVNNVVVYSGLKGTVYTASVKEWKRDKEFLLRLLALHDLRSDRGFVTETLKEELE